MDGNPKKVFTAVRAAEIAWTCPATPIFRTQVAQLLQDREWASSFDPGSLNRGRSFICPPVVLPNHS
jgi:hypothetical protein